MRRGLALAIATGAALLAIAPAAQADHHFVSIAEVFPGVSENPDAEFVEIQMFSAGPEQLRARREPGLLQRCQRATRDASSARTSRTAPISARLLAGTAAMETTVREAGRHRVRERRTRPCGRRGVPRSSSVFATRRLRGLGHRHGLQAPARPRLRSPTARRSCATSARAATRCSSAGDDTDSSAADFSAPAFPTPSRTPRPDQLDLPQHDITKTPKAKTKDRTPKFEFSGGDRFRCNLDERGLRRVRHAVSRRASSRRASTSSQCVPPRRTARVDGTPAKYAWKIVKKKNSRRLAACPGLEDPAQVVRAVGWVHLERPRAGRSARRGHLRGRGVRVEKRAVEAALAADRAVEDPRLAVEHLAAEVVLAEDPVEAADRGVAVLRRRRSPPRARGAPSAPSRPGGRSRPRRARPPCRASASKIHGQPPSGRWSSSRRPATRRAVASARSVRVAVPRRDRQARGRRRSASRSWGSGRAGPSRGGVNSRPGALARSSWRSRARSQSS